MASSLMRTVARATGVAMLGATGAALALAGLNQLVARTAPEPQPPLDVPPQRFGWHDGDCMYSVSGTGRAVVLLHGIYAGASSYEFRRIFPLLAKHLRVFAPDMPGCGLSARPARVYHPDLYVEFILDFVQQVAGGTDHPVQIVASSLSAAFAIKAAAARPDLFERLVLIEPVGIQQLANTADATQHFAGKLLRTPLIGMSLYHALVSRAGLRYFLRQQIYADPSRVSDDMIDAYYAVAHQPNARYAASSFVGGELNLDIADDFEALTQPTLLCWGRDAAQSPMDLAEAFLERNAQAELAIFDHCAALPHDEDPADFTQQVLAWLGVRSSSQAR
jgi:pimeloyl-ACP methyl ester carboxylesterase